jgi:hypothetical protein
MKKYAKVIDNRINLCQVGLGNNEAYYKSIGMRKMDVEQAWDGSWYLVGFAPEKPEDVKKQERIAELKDLLASWDYKTSKYVDGEYTEEEWQAIIEQRAAWREEIRELEI